MLARENLKLRYATMCRLWCSIANAFKICGIAYTFMICGKSLYSFHTEVNTLCHLYNTCEV